MLSRQAAVYIPSTIGARRAPPGKVRAAVRSAGSELARDMGGASAVDVEGFYLSASGKMVREKVKKVYVFADDDSISAASARVRAIAERIKTEFSQESVAVEIDGTMIFV